MSWQGAASGHQWPDDAGDWRSSSSGWARPTGGTSSSSAGPAAQPAGEEEKRAGEPAIRCFGAAGCPWCMLHLPYAEHHDLNKLGQRVANLKLTATISNQKLPKDMLMHMQFVYFALASACVKHTEMHHADQDFTDDKKVLAMLGVLCMPAATASAASSSTTAPGMVPPPPPWPEDADPPANAGSRNKKNKNKKNFDWEQDGAWRYEPKVPADPIRQRGVRIETDHPPYHAFLEGDARQQVLRFYDNANIKETIRDIRISDGRVFDYRFEGGMYMSQKNTTWPDRPRREVTIVYCEPGQS
jgi:hypothetical protein